jgi:hypothetical protein
MSNTKGVAENMLWGGRFTRKCPRYPANDHSHFR